MSEPRRGWRARFRAWPNDSTAKTLVVALTLCLVCSVVVSTASLVLKPRQQANAAYDRKRNILEVAGLLRADADVDELFAQVETRLVALDSGDYVDQPSAAGYDQRKAARDPASSRALGAEQDIAGIGRRADYAPVYLVHAGGRLATVVLPVHGYGLWSTLYGFLALRGDGHTVLGLQFYEHAETPGLGAAVDSPQWRAQWAGKQAYGPQGEPWLEVIKGRVTAGPDANHQVDGLAGATLTSRGVTNLLQFWLGEQGFGPYLQRLRREASQ